MLNLSLYMWAFVMIGNVIQYAKRHRMDIMASNIILCMDGSMYFRDRN